MKSWVFLAMFFPVIPVLLFVSMGCDESEIKPPALNKKIVSTPEKPTLNRFTVESFGTFHAGYQDSLREVMIITDTETGIKYLSVTGCGTTEMRQESSGKSTVTRER